MVEIINAILGIPTAKAYTYAAAEVTAVGTELSAMLTAYLPAILLIFATLFALGYFAHLVRKWIGGRR